MSSLEGFSVYQHQHAWVWEHQALTRAREAREAPCVEVREQLANLAGRVPRRRNDVSA